MIGAKARIFVFRLVCFWKIWCYNQESRRFDEKFGDSRENREIGSCPVSRSSRRGGGGALKEFLGGDVPLGAWNP